MFEADVFSERRRELVKSLGSGIVLLPGHVDSPMNYADNIYPFRQDSTFLYYVGIHRPGLFAVIDVDEDQTTIFGKEPTVDDVIWSGLQPGLEELRELCGADHVCEISDLAEILSGAIAQKRDLHYLPPYRAEISRGLEKLMGLEPEQSKGGHSEELIRAIVAQRSVKETRELAEIEAALTVTQQMYRAAMQIVQAGKYERELAGLVEGIAISGGGRLAYPCILTKHGQVLHNHDYHRRLESGDLVVQDSGAATVSGYASDITRTYPVGGTFSSRQREIYQAVLDSLISALSSIQPGRPFQASHLVAARVLTDRLQQIGLMRGDLDESVAAGAHALFFPHGLGHMMGLDVHDMENLGEDLVGYDDQIRRSQQFGLRSLRFGRAPAPGFVLTVEPGCYFIGPLIDQWRSEKRHEAFINYDRLTDWRDFGGVRIEENIVVTPEGHRTLGPRIPRTIADVEAACSG
ncbi:MAG: aminopeptidase P family protein [Rhodothermaceae bacterium]|nr:aminopeptidase P family protein [Rhodothermaceae bacterium]MYG70414.1 aminopeptidase P family protein [Rhodothermaceae bacterium]MYJ44564.1 aminopeptidase P family protein [Rhodothermaceae bacterium]